MPVLVSRLHPFASLFAYLDLEPDHSFHVGGTPFLTTR